MEKEVLEIIDKMVKIVYGSIFSGMPLKKDQYHLKSVTLDLVDQNNREYWTYHVFVAVPILSKNKTIYFTFEHE